MRRFFTSTGLSESENAIVEDPNDPIYDPDQEQEVVNNNNRENNLHWDYVDTTNRERPHIADNSVNILVVGDKNVGKTALIDQYANGMSQTTAQT
jgi:polynucleotide 5'-kinase involved in rRNA processing